MSFVIADIKEEKSKGISLVIKVQGKINETKVLYAMLVKDGFGKNINLLLLRAVAFLWEKEILILFKAFAYVYGHKEDTEIEDDNHSKGSYLQGREALMED